MPSVLFNILVIDSNAADADRIETLLQTAFSTGVAVHVAADMETAKTHLAVHDIHLAIADMNVSPFTGPAIVDHLRRIRPTLPVLCVTQTSDLSLSLAVMAAGAAMLIDKASLSTADQPLTKAVVSILAESRQRAQTNGLTRQIDAIHSLLQQTHQRLERILSSVERHDADISDHAQRIDRIDTTVRTHERQRRGLLAVLWAMATAVIVSLADRLL